MDEKKRESEALIRNHNRCAALMQLVRGRGHTQQVPVDMQLHSPQSQGKTPDLVTFTKEGGASKTAASCRA